MTTHGMTPLVRLVAIVCLLGLGVRPVAAQDQSPAELQTKLDALLSEINDIRQIRAFVMDPRYLLWFDFSNPGSVTFSGRTREEYQKGVADRVLKGKMSPGQAAKLTEELDAMMGYARRLMDRQLKEKEALATQLSAKLANANATPPNATPWSWLGYSGSVEGRATFTCATPASTIPPTGPFTLTFLNGVITSLGAFGRGRVADDGSASGGRGPDFTWWGRFRRGSDGSIQGKGVIAPREGAVGCSGDWSVP